MHDGAKRSRGVVAIETIGYLMAVPVFFFIVASPFLYYYFPEAQTASRGAWLRYLVEGWYVFYRVYQHWQLSKNCKISSISMGINVALAIASVCAIIVVIIGFSRTGFESYYYFLTRQTSYKIPLAGIDFVFFLFELCGPPTFFLELFHYRRKRENLVGSAEQEDGTKGSMR